MRATYLHRTILIVIILFITAGQAQSGYSPKAIFNQNRTAICQVSFYQNIASDSKIGSFNKIKKNRIGIIVKPNGLIMVSSDVYPVSLDIISTNASMLSEKPSDFKVKLWNEKEYPAIFLGKDDQAEVAFIKLTGLVADEELPYIQFRSTTHLGVADTLYTLELLNQDYNYQPLFTPHDINAVIESPRRKFLINNFTTALSAGGLVLDAKGRAIGITLKTSINFSFRPPQEFDDFQKDYLEIAPSEWFNHLIENPPKIAENEIARKSWIGIRMQGLSKNLQKYWKVPQDGGIVVNQVYPESPAENAGLRQKDVILAINDTILKARNDEETNRFRTIIRDISPGKMVELKIFRDGKISRKKVKLTAAPESISLAESFQVPDIGFEIRELTRDVLYNENLPLSTPGVFVFQVDRASPAGLAGLRIGDILQEINGHSIKDLQDAKVILQKLEPDSKQELMLRVSDNRTTRFVFINPNK